MHLLLQASTNPCPVAHVLSQWSNSISVQINALAMLLEPPRVLYVFKYSLCLRDYGQEIIEPPITRIRMSGVACSPAGGTETEFISEFKVTLNLRLRGKILHMCTETEIIEFKATLNLESAPCAHMGTDLVIEFEGALGASCTGVRKRRSLPKPRRFLRT